MKPPNNRITHFLRSAIIPIAGFLLLAASATADARSWRGEVSYQGSPRAGANVEICGVSDKTNNSGRFRIELPDNETSCTIVVSYANRVSNTRTSGPVPYLSLSLKRDREAWVLEIR
jgi:hypothetical protein